MSILRMVNRAFKRLDKEEFLVIYKSLIRTHLEYRAGTDILSVMKKYWKRFREEQ